MKDLKLGYLLSQDYNVVNSFSLDEFNYSFLNGIGYNFGVLKNYFTF
jgi:hypothetical protein